MIVSPLREYLPDGNDLMANLLQNNGSLLRNGSAEGIWVNGRWMSGISFHRLIMKSCYGDSIFGEKKMWIFVPSSKFNETTAKVSFSHLMQLRDVARFDIFRIISSNPSSQLFSYYSQHTINIMPVSQPE